MRLVTESELESFAAADAASQMIEIVGPTASIQLGGISIAKTVLADGGRVEPHLHRRSIEIYLFTAGVGTMTVGTEQFDVHSGVTVLIETEEPHHLVAHGTEALEFFAVSSPAWTPADHLPVADPT